MLDLMELSVEIWNDNVNYFKNTMQNCWLKDNILPPYMMAELRNLISNNE